MSGVSMLSPVLPSIVLHFGASTQAMGAIMSCFAVAMSIGSLITGRAADKLGPRVLIIGCLLGSGSTLLLSAFAWNITAFIFFRTVTGLFASTTAVVMSYIGAISRSATERAERVSFINAVIAASYIIGPTLGGLLHGISVMAPLLAAGLVTIAASVSAMLTLPPPPPQHAQHGNDGAADGRAGVVTTQPPRAATGADEVAAADSGQHAASGGAHAAAAPPAVEGRPGGRSGRVAYDSVAKTSAEPAAAGGAQAAPVDMAAPAAAASTDHAAGAGAAGAELGMFASVDGAVDQPPQQLPDRSVLVSTAIRDPAVLLLLASAFIGQISGSGFAFLNVVAINTLGWTPAREIAVFYGVAGASAIAINAFIFKAAVAAVGIVPVGVYAFAMRAVAWVAMPAMVLLARDAAPALGPWAAVIVIVPALVVTIGFTLTSSVSSVLLLDIIEKRDGSTVRGEVLSWLMFVQTVANIFGPLALGALTELSLVDGRITFYACAACCVVSVALLVAMNRALRSARGTGEHSKRWSLGGLAV